MGKKNLAWRLRLGCLKSCWARQSRKWQNCLRRLGCNVSNWSFCYWHKKAELIHSGWVPGEVVWTIVHQMLTMAYCPPCNWRCGMWRQVSIPLLLYLSRLTTHTGTRFLLVASLAVISLSRDRLLHLPPNHDIILNYLHNLPQDSLLLPAHFMKACEETKFEEKEYKKIRNAMEKNHVPLAWMKGA